ncbi:MAG: hypothetical protein D6808_01600 [Candidatus Dadabacteria bacterium]|nr:MAG: hypothetical protein D6808_01600 [Candidatus Dadabacteria bacterium]
MKSYPQFQKGQFEFDLSDYTQSSLFAAEASCTPPSQEEFFAGVPPEFLTQIIDAFLQLFPPGTTIDEAIAQVSCPDSNNNLSSGDIPTGTPGEQINDPEIPYGYISANTVIPFDACSPRKTQYEVQVVVDLSEVSKEILHKQPMITVSVKAYKPQRDQRALIKPNSEGGGACHSATIVLAKTTGSYYGEKLDVVHWSQGTFNKIKSFPIYKGYFSNYAKYCVQPYLTGRRENFIMYNVSRTAAYSFCARFAQKRQELNGY